MRLRTLAHSTLALAALLGACSGGEEPENKAPTVTIGSPGPGLELPWGAPLTLEATVADDAAEPVPEEAIVWSSSLDGELGTGRHLVVEGLSFGTHEITVMVTDAGGLGALASTTVTVSQLLTAASWMTGHFSSAQQSVDQPAYYDITLHMARIWPGRTDGLWIYVEQAVTGDLPYRQRVYRLFEADGVVQDEIYELAAPGAWTGVWEDPTRVATLGPGSLDLKPGCDVYFLWAEDHFEGGTEGEDCPTTLNGATYATTEIWLGPSLLTSWDQGWDDQGRQQWGPTAGPYEFEKLADYPLQ